MNTPLQRDLAILGGLTNELKELDAKLVAACDTMPQAYQVCMSRARVQYSYDDWAEQVGLTTSHFKQIVSTNKNKAARYMPPEAENRLMQVSGNLCPEQWRKMERMGLLNCQRQPIDEVAELERQLAEAKQRASM